MQWAVPVITSRVEAGLAALPHTRVGPVPCRGRRGVHTQPEGQEPCTAQGSGRQSPHRALGQLHHPWAMFTWGTPCSLPAPRSLHRPCPMLTQPKHC